MYKKNDWVVITIGYYSGERARIMKINSDGSLDLRIGNGNNKDVIVPKVSSSHVRKA